MTSDADRPDLITRREAILRVSALFGGMALVGQGAMLAGCRQRTPDAAAFTQDEIAFLGEIAETILPETDTPGAKTAGVGPFIALMVVDTYDAREQQVFREGMATVDDECNAMHGASFMDATPEQRLVLLENLDAEQWQYTEQHGDKSPAHYFRMMKELALLGYFTSEIGYNQAMRYAERPGRYDPCVPWEPGKKTWAAHA